MKKEQRKIAIRLTVVLALVAMLGCDRFSSNTETLETASVTIAPAVPPPIARTKPAHVVIDLSISEEERPLADGVTYEFWSYNGHTPARSSGYASATLSRFGWIIRRVNSPIP